MRDTIDMAREAGIDLDLIDEDEGQIWYITTEGMKAFEALVRADERNRTWTQDHWTEYERSIAAQEREACAYRAGIALLGADRGLTNRVDQAIRARSNA
jgi:hypothetical protein